MSGVTYTATRHRTYSLLCIQEDCDLAAEQHLLLLRWTQLTVELIVRCVLATVIVMAASRMNP